MNTEILNIAHCVVEKMSGPQKQTAEYKNAIVSIAIFTLKNEMGLTTKEAVDAVLGAGTYEKLADEVWAASQN